MLTGKKIIKYSAFALLCLLIIIAIYKDSSEIDTEYLINADGNLIFYNNPVAQEYQDGFFVAYLTTNGKVKLDYLMRGKVLVSKVVHDYADQINRQLGYADDHAAPAIIIDKINNRLLIATAYHGTDLYIYEYSFASNELSLLNSFNGRYTYPRFIYSLEDVFLLARNQPLKSRGDLVVRKLSDNFSFETIAVTAPDGHVIYGGSAATSAEGFYIAYSVHSYQENRLIGLTLINYDLISNEVINQCDLENYLDGSYYSNRPTGLGYDGENLMIGTAFFDKNNSIRNSIFDNFRRKNTVLILKGNMSECDAFEIEEKKDNISMPYYDTSVAINDMSEYLFFDNSKVYTNIKYSNCFQNTEMMYPNFLGNKYLIYSTMNKEYSIRDFNNSILACARQ